MKVFYTHPVKKVLGGLVIQVLFFTFFVFLLSGIAFSQQKQNELNAQLFNLESVTKDPFRFNLTLHNAGTESLVYQLDAKSPIGWVNVIRTQGNQVTAIKVEPGSTLDIAVELSAASTTKPGKYVVPFSAVSSADTLSIDLEAVVKGNYAVELTTPTGRLSDEITEGKSRKISLVVKNTGTLPLEELTLSAQTPSQWGSTFEPSKIEKLGAGESKEVTATLSVPNKTIAGDYVTTFDLRGNEANANAVFRMTVTTSLLSGWLGIVVILLAIGLVYYLIRKYGRR